MICVAHGGHYLALHVLIAGRALGTVQLLIVQGTIVGAILGEKAASRQRFVAFGALEARFVEISVRNTQHLAGAFFLAFAALDFRFTHFAGYLLVFVFRFCYFLVCLCRRRRLEVFPSLLLNHQSVPSSLFSTFRQQPGTFIPPPRKNRRQNGTLFFHR